MAIKCKIYALISPKTPEEYRYIGQTQQSLTKRLSGHLYDAERKNNYVQCWIRKLIKQNIKPQIILIDNNGIWNESEKYYIQKYRKDGHKLTNLTDGGNAFSGMSGEYNPFYGKKHSEETKRKISKSRIGKYTGKNNPNYGNILSEQLKEKMGMQNRKSVICLNDNNIFISMSEAAKYYFIPVQYVSLSISKGRPRNNLQFKLVQGDK